MKVALCLGLTFFCTIWTIGCHTLPLQTFPRTDKARRRFPHHFTSLFAWSDEIVPNMAFILTGLRNLLFGKEKSFFATVAIDLGTTYSGFAFSLNKEQGESSMIFMNKDWVNEQGHRTSKTPTCLLLKPDQLFDSFGYKAAERYAYLRSVYEAQDEFFFFELFKMAVHNDQVLELENTLLKASNGRALKAITVFAHCIKFLRNEALKVIRQETGDENCGVKDILWVLSVPVMWTARSKQFMREAAYEAGIGSRGNPGQVMILTEAEAAAHFCVKTEIKKDIPSETRPAMQDKASTPFLLADIGGGRLDMAVYQQHGDDSIEEIYKETSDVYGADMISITRQFEDVLAELFGAQVLNDYRILFPSDWLKIRQEFEVKKHDIQNGETKLHLPGSFIASVNDFRSPSMKKYTKGEVKILDDEYLCLSPSVVLRLLWPFVESVKHNLGALLSKPQLSKVKTIFLVGGCANSLLQEQIQNEFACKYCITVPPNALVVVAKGAVMVALTTAATKRRVVGTSYGADCSRNFVRGKHPEEKKFLLNGEDNCRDLFNCFVKGTDTVKHGQEISVRYRPREANQTEIRYTFYAAPTSDTMFVTDPGLTEIGSVLVHSPDTRQGLERDIFVSMYFGGTEIIATAWDVTSGNRAQTTLDVSGLTRSISVPRL